MTLRVAVLIGVAALTQGCVNGKTTTCGVLVVNATHFEEVQALENEFVELTGQYVAMNDSRFSETCKALNGWSVSFVAMLQNSQGEDLGGQTWVNTREMIIEEKDSVRKGSLVHEFAHAVQRGEPRHDCAGGYDTMHDCWDQHGISYVIDTIRGEN